MKIAALSLTMILMAGAISTWAHAPRPAAAVASATLSPYELQLHIDTKTLPEQQIDNLF
jgi:hypothetical protein